MRFARSLSILRVLQRPRFCCCLVASAHPQFAAVIKSKNKDGWTPLHQAAYAGSLKCAEVIRSPARHAVPETSTRLVPPPPLISSSSLPKPTSCASASERERISRIARLILIRCRDGDTPAHYAAAQVSFEIVVRVVAALKLPASCFHKHRSRNPKGHIDVIRALVAQGGPSILDIQDADGQPASSHYHAFKQRASSLACVGPCSCGCAPMGIPTLVTHVPSLPPSLPHATRRR